MVLDSIAIWITYASSRTRGGALPTLRVPANFLTSVQLVCTSPTWPSAGTAQVRLLEDGAAVRLVGPSSLSFRFTAEGWTSGSPQEAYTDSKGNLTIYGSVSIRPQGTTMPPFRMRGPASVVRARW